MTGDNQDVQLLESIVRDIVDSRSVEAARKILKDFKKICDQIQQSLEGQQ